MITEELSQNKPCATLPMSYDNQNIESCFASIAYRIKKIDLVSQHITLLQAIDDKEITCKLSNAYCNEIIDGLSSNDALYLGLSIGKLISCLIQKDDESSNFILKQRYGKYQLLSENRNGLISYADTVHHHYFTESVLSMIQNNFIITEFDSTASFQLGIIAGNLLHSLLRRKLFFTEEEILTKYRHRMMLRLVD